MSKLKVAVVGLGYVGLPIAVAFGRRGVTTIGFDINAKRVKSLQLGVDGSGDVTKQEIRRAKTLTFTDDPTQLKKANFIIIAVPTPVTKANKPDLSLIEKASQLVGQNLTKGAIVVYESTVYPGVTEEICVPILEGQASLKCGKDFKIGYSPERINPGDKAHSLAKIVKVVAGMDKSSTDIIARVYKLVCRVGIYRAKDIKTAEAAKVIENTQRDLNIALINELSLIFNRIGIDTFDVLDTAGTKWNFLNFTPGLVGGHCIGVDPYYLVHKAEELGYHPQIIAAGRRVNDYMPEFIAQETVKALTQAGKTLKKAKVLVIGLAFKENVKDTRNSKIAVTIAKLKELGVNVKGYDPMLAASEIKAEFDLTALDRPKGRFDGIIVATPHAEFKKLERTLPRLLIKPGVIIDIKKFFPNLANRKNIIYKSL